MNSKVVAVLLVACLSTGYCLDVYRVGVLAARLSSPGNLLEDNSNNAANANDSAYVNNIGQVVQEIQWPTTDSVNNYS
ncbi:unnamed protein product [Pieris brassicae]|uniref:Salivary secreted peptide n=1 Tax=Pieris brassicae TaxID=7116 RepID=A0A9P0XBV2_PIEBR|nr:unnamed protein product [Pieris brassicae]